MSATPRSAGTRDSHDGHSVEKGPSTEVQIEKATSDFDANDYYRRNQGRLVVDPKEAQVEFGPEVAGRLKLSRDGTKVLWPQPTDDPRDPQNWSDKRKTIQLAIITLAAFVPDFDSSIGIAGIFKLAKEYHTTPGVINNLTSNWSIFLLGWGSIFAVMLMRRYGRLPVLFWSQVLALGFLVGATFAPNLASFAGFRCLTAFFGTCPQVTGLYIVTDMYPFHLQARKINIWTMGFIGSPFVGPFLLGFMVPRTGWRWAYGVGCFYGLLVLILIAVFMEETLYDRGREPPATATESGARYRLETLIGITGYRKAHLRARWSQIILAPVNIVWRPQILGILIFEGLMFGFGIGINVTNAVFLEEPRPEGLGFRPDAIAAMYATPIVAVIIGELIGRYLNDSILDIAVRRHNGVFEAENRLWTCYLAVPLFICGFVLLGASIQDHLSVVAVIFGWGIAEVSIMVTTVAVYAYCNDCFPDYQGEISGLINLSRTLGGFAVAYFQVPWALKHGALQTFGCEAAIVTGLFLIFVPFIQVKGRTLRSRYGLNAVESG